jgi:hypothetical protein
MKRLRYIIACLLSVLIIYVGAGVAVMHYCCNSCESSHVESHQHGDMSCEVQHAQHATASSCGSCSVQETPSCGTSASVKHQSVATHGEQLVPQQRLYGKHLQTRLGKILFRVGYYRTGYKPSVPGITRFDGVRSPDGRRGSSLHGYLAACRRLPAISGSLLYLTYLVVRYRFFDE